MCQGIASATNGWSSKSPQVSPWLRLAAHGTQPGHRGAGLLPGLGAAAAEVRGRAVRAGGPWAAGPRNRIGRGWSRSMETPKEGEGSKSGLLAIGHELRRDHGLFVHLGGTWKK